MHKLAFMELILFKIWILDINFISTSILLWLNLLSVMICYYVLLLFITINIIIIFKIIIVIINIIIINNVPISL